MLSTIRNLDFFAQPEPLRVKTKKKPKTVIGALISISVAAIILTISLKNYLKILDDKNLKFYSTHTSEFKEEFYLNKHNLIFFFGLQLKNSTFYVDDSLFIVKAYQIEHFTNSNSDLSLANLTKTALDLTKCSDIFTANEVKTANLNLPLEKFFCFSPNKAKIGGFKGGAVYSSIQIEFLKCSNSILNFSNETEKCKPPDLIDFYVENSYVTVYSSDTAMDQRDVEAPLRKSFKRFHLKASKFLITNLNFEFNKVSFIDHLGFVFVEKKVVEYLKISGHQRSFAAYDQVGFISQELIKNNNYDSEYNYNNNDIFTDNAKNYEYDKNKNFLDIFATISLSTVELVEEIERRDLDADDLISQIGGFAYLIYSLSSMLHYCVSKPLTLFDIVLTNHPSSLELLISKNNYDFHAKNKSVSFNLSPNFILTRSFNKISNKRKTSGVLATHGENPSKNEEPLSDMNVKRSNKIKEAPELERELNLSQIPSTANTKLIYDLLSKNKNENRNKLNKADNRFINRLEEKGEKFNYKNKLDYDITINEVEIEDLNKNNRKSQFDWLTHVRPRSISNNNLTTSSNIQESADRTNRKYLMNKTELTNFKNFPNDFLNPDEIKVKGKPYVSNFNIETCTEDKYVQSTNINLISSEGDSEIESDNGKRIQKSENAEELETQGQIKMFKNKSNFFMHQGIKSLSRSDNNVTSPLGKKEKKRSYVLTPSKDKRHKESFSDNLNHLEIKIDNGISNNKYSAYLSPTKARIKLKSEFLKADIKKKGPNNKNTSIAKNNKINDTEKTNFNIANINNQLKYLSEINRSKLKSSSNLIDNSEISLMKPQAHRAPLQFKNPIAPFRSEITCDQNETHILNLLENRYREKQSEANANAKAIEESNYLSVLKKGDECIENRKYSITTKIQSDQINDFDNYNNFNFIFNCNNNNNKKISDSKSKNKNEVNENEKANYQKISLKDAFSFQSLNKNSEDVKDCSLKGPENRGIKTNISKEVNEQCGKISFNNNTVKKGFLLRLKICFEYFCVCFSKEKRFYNVIKKQEKVLNYCLSVEKICKSFFDLNFIKSFLLDNQMKIMLERLYSNMLVQNPKIAEINNFLVFDKQNGFSELFENDDFIKRTDNIKKFMKKCM